MLIGSEVELLIDTIGMIVAMALGGILYTIHYLILNAMAVKYKSYELKMKWSLASILLTLILGLGFWVLNIQFMGILLVFGVGIGLSIDIQFLDKKTRNSISNFQLDEALENMKSQLEQTKIPRGLMNDE